MKKSFLGITILMFLMLSIQGCGFDTKGEKISKYSTTKSALLIIDIQQGLTGKNAKIPIGYRRSGRVIQKINTLIEKSVTANIDVIYITTQYNQHDFWGNLFTNWALTEGTQNAQFDPRLRLINRNIFLKRQPDAFSNPDLNLFLIRNQIDHIYISGLMSDGRVFWTTKGALNRGIK